MWASAWPSPAATRRNATEYPPCEGVINESNSNPPPVFNFEYTLSNLVLHQVQFPYTKNTTFQRPSSALCKAIFCAREGTEIACVDPRQKKV